MEKNITYENYLEQNAKVINNILGIPILFSALVGPVCALLKLTGIFTAMSYKSCLITTILSLVAAGIHYVLVKTQKDSRTTAFFILGLLEVIIVYMRFANFNVSLALFIVPMLSLLYCERKTYYVASLIGFVGMIVGLFLSKEHWGEILVKETANSWLVSYGISYIMEFLLMFVVGFTINAVINWHMGITYSDRLVINKREEEIYKDKLTGTWNKLYIFKAFTKFAVQSNKKCSLVVVNLEGLQDIRTAHGSSEADRAVTTFAKVMKQIFNDEKHAVLCHTEPDEFTVLISEMSSDLNLTVLLEMLKKEGEYNLKSDAKYRGMKFYSGAAAMTSTTMSFDELRFLAENALLKAKEDGNTSFHVYEDGEVSNAALARVRRKQTKVN